MWNSKKDNEKPVTDGKKHKTDILQSLPQQSKYYTSFRTDAILNKTMSGDDFVEFYAAVQLTPDRWRLMQYSFYDVKNPEDSFTSKIVGDMSFPEAVYEISQQETVLDGKIKVGDLQVYERFDLSEEKFPPQDHKILRDHFFNLTHYEKACYAEGIVFDALGDPQGRHEGLIITNARFNNQKLEQGISENDNAEQSAPEGPAMKEGLLSEIFYGVSTKGDLEESLKTYEAIHEMNSVAKSIAAYYINLQEFVGETPSMDAVSALPADGRQALLDEAKQVSAHLCYEDDDFVTRAEKILEYAEGKLDAVKEKGYYTEPFELMVGECRVTSHLFNAQKMMNRLRENFSTSGDGNVNVLSDVRDSTERAIDSFRELGATEHMIDKARARVMTGDTLKMPKYLSQFLNRYYTSRDKILKNRKMQAKTFMAPRN